MDLRAQRANTVNLQKQSLDCDEALCISAAIFKCLIELNPTFGITTEMLVVLTYRDFIYFHTEPQMCEPDLCFQPLFEALKVLKSENQSFFCTGDNPQSETGVGTLQEFLYSNCEFTEKMRAEVPSSENTEMEDFNKLCLEHVDGEESVLSLN